MRKNEENSSKKRILDLLHLLIKEPSIHTKSDLAKIFKVSNDTIKSDFKVLRASGFEIECSDYPHYVFFVKNLVLGGVKSPKIKMLINDDPIYQKPNKIYKSSIVKMVKEMLEKGYSSDDIQKELGKNRNYVSAVISYIKKSDK